MSADGSRVAVHRFTGTEPGQPADLRIVDAQTGHDISVLTGLTGYVRTAAFSVDGERLFAGSEDEARIWNTSGDTVVTFAKHDGKIAHGGLSADGRHAVTCSTDTIRVWNVRSSVASLVRSIPWKCAAAALSRTGARLVAGDSKGTAQLWDVSQGDVLGTVKAHDGAITSLSFSPDRNLIVSASQDKLAKLLLDFDLGTVGTLQGHQDPLAAASFSADGRMVVTAAEDGTARVWALDPNLFSRALVGHTRPITNIGYSSDGRRIISVSEDGTARVWDAANDHAPTVIGDSSTKFAKGAWSPDLARVVTIDSQGLARLWAGPMPIGPLRESTELVTHARFSGDGERVFTAATDGAVRFWASDSGRLIRALQIGDDEVHSAALSPDDRVLVAAHGSQTDTVQVWDTRTFERIGVFNVESPGTFEFLGNGGRLIEEAGIQVNCTGLTHSSGAHANGNSHAPHYRGNWVPRWTDDIHRRLQPDASLLVRRDRQDPVIAWQPHRHHAPCRIFREWPIFGGG